MLLIVLIAENIKSATAGDIVALAGLKHTITGHTLLTQKIQFYSNLWNFQTQL